MGLPRAPEARPFYQAAYQRFEDARFLLDNGRTTGAVYLAGYSVECILKALILSVTPSGRRSQVEASFRTATAHNYEWPRRVYLRNGGVSFPLPITRQFLRVNTWSSVLRYRAGTVRRREAVEFLEAAEAIMTWADGRF